MPELPEVETIVLGLNSKVVGLKIKDLQVLNPKSFLGNPDILVGKEIQGVGRRGKVILICLESDLTVMIHLKMSGQLIWIGPEQERVVGGHPNKDLLGELPTKSTRVIFTLSDNSTLYFNDQRKFGWVRVVDSRQLTGDSFLNNLGPEPLEKDFTLEVFKGQILKRKNAPIKVAILDQQIIAGVGNIYASEACFMAGLDPRRKVSSLDDSELKKLHQGVVESLQMGVKHGGSSKTHYLNLEGKRGNFLDFAFVYARAGQKCKKCQNNIVKIKLGGRGTYYCKFCQL